MKKKILKGKVQKALEDMKYWYMCRTMPYKELKAYIAGEIIYPFWQCVINRSSYWLHLHFPTLLKKIHCNYRIQYFKGLIFAICNSSSKRFWYSFWSWCSIFLASFAISFIYDKDPINSKVCNSFILLMGLAIIEVLIIQYHTVRIFQDEVKDKYIPDKQNKQANGLVPLTGGKLIPNNLWFYQSYDYLEYFEEDRADLQDIQFSIHGDEYRICHNNIWKYFFIMGCFYYVFF